MAHSYQLGAIRARPILTSAAPIGSPLMIYLGAIEKLRAPAEPAEFRVALARLALKCSNDISTSTLNGYVRRRGLVTEK